MDGAVPSSKQGTKMARLILIDNNSGYIFGEHTSSDRLDDELLVAAARSVDTEIDPSEAATRTYEARTSAPRDTSTGYHVYRSDVRGSDQIGNIINGQDQELIAAVQRDCEFVGYVACTSAQ